MTDKWQAGKTYVPGSLVVPASAVPVVMPPLVNGDFETGDLSSWTATAQSGNWSISNFAYRGTYCLHCVGGNVATIRNDTRGQVEAGTQVSAQAVANFHNNGTDDMGCELALYWYDASDAFISQDEGASLTGKGGSYKAFSVLGYAPTNAKFVRLVIGANTGTHGGDISFDNVTWSSNYSAPPSGLVYKATQAAPGKSGTSEPSWPGVTGVPVTDNQVTWEGVIATRIVWEAIPLLKSGDTEPVWPEDISGMVSDGAINWKAVSRRIEDVNCPQSKIVAIMASKVFAADKDIVRFSATVNPLDWTSGQDAGFLPTGLQQANANDMAVLAPYRSNMTAFNASSFQNWQVDPDPSAMALLDQMEGIGSTWQHAAQPVGNELFYLSQLGVRSVSIAAGADSLSASDVGIPIDALVQLAMKADATELGPLAIYYPSSGQYWLAFSNYPSATIDGEFSTTLTSNLYPQQLTERTAWAMTPGDVTIHTEIKRYTSPAEKSAWSMTPGTLTLHSITQYYTQPAEKSAWSLAPGTATITTRVKRYTQPAEKTAWAMTPGTLTLKTIVIRYTNPAEKTAWALSPGTVTITTS